MGLSPADRIALARELLEGTGRVVARDVPRRTDPVFGDRANGFNEGWNACRSEMLEPNR